MRCHARSCERNRGEVSNSGVRVQSSDSRFERFRDDNVNPDEWLKMSQSEEDSVSAEEFENEN
jgi:hypothetical protein